MSRAEPWRWCAELARKSGPYSLTVGGIKRWGADIRPGAGSDIRGDGDGLRCIDTSLVRTWSCQSRRAATVGTLTLGAVLGFQADIAHLFAGDLTLGAVRGLTTTGQAAALAQLTLARHVAIASSRQIAVLSALTLARRLSLQATGQAGAVATLALNRLLWLALLEAVYSGKHPDCRSYDVPAEDRTYAVSGRSLL